MAGGEDFGGIGDQPDDVLPLASGGGVGEEPGGGTAEGRSVDVTDADSAAETVKAIHSEHGRIDILVNNAGVTRDQLLVRMKPADWDLVLRINLDGVFKMTQPTAKIMMRQRSGRIVNIASVVGLMGNAGQTNYSSSKAGLIGFTKSLARELGPRNVTARKCPELIAGLGLQKFSRQIFELAGHGPPKGRPADKRTIAIKPASDCTQPIRGDSYSRIDLGERLRITKADLAPLRVIGVYAKYKVAAIYANLLPGGPINNNQIERIRVAL